MKKIKLEEIEKLIGNTPIVKIQYEYKEKVRNSYFKCEWYNLSGSIKDRAAFGIIKNSYEKGILHERQTIVETTSGNMGISFCAIGSMLSHKVIIFMPKFMSEERKELIKLFGAELRLTENFHDAFEEAKKLEKKGCFLTLQFDNKDNTNAHYLSTGAEIEKQTNGNISAFISGIGTGGTLMGAGGYLKEKLNIPLIAVDPDNAKLFTLGYSVGKHKIQGLSDEIIPGIYDKNLVDKIIPISDNDAIAMAQKISRELGLGVGISSGANFIGSVLSCLDNTASVFADDNKKYLSSGLGNIINTPLVDSINLLNFEVIK